MAAFLKQAGALLVGQMAGSNNKASFIVKTLRTGYVLNASLIGVIWYTAYRNERISPGEIKFPIPGMEDLRRKFPPDRPEKELPRPEPGQSWGSSVGRLPKEKLTKEGLLNPLSGFMGMPQTPAEAKAMAGLATFEGTKVAAWIAPYLHYGRSKGWKGAINSGWRSYSEQVAIWNSGVRPAARPGTSNHEKKVFPGGAVDVEEAEVLDAILKKLPGGSLLKFAGAVDPVHFSFPHNGSY